MVSDNLTRKYVLEKDWKNGRMEEWKGILPSFYFYISDFFDLLREEFFVMGTDIDLKRPRASLLLY